MTNSSFWGFLAALQVQLEEVKAEHTQMAGSTFARDSQVPEACGLAQLRVVR